MDRSGFIAKPVIEAHTRPGLAPSKISEPLVWLGRRLLPLYLRFVLSFRSIDVWDPADIVEAIKDFQDRKTRLIVAFRHPYGDEPQLVFHVFENMIPRYAKKLGTPLNKRPRLRIIHDYAVPLWGGAFIRFLLPRAGAMPVFHTKFEPASLKTIRHSLRDGDSPVGIAPEGQISYHSETLPRIEQGTIRMGFWCANDIERAGRPEKVLVMPLTVHYRYDFRDRSRISAALDRIEKLLGQKPVRVRRSEITTQQLYDRIEPIESQLLELTEDHYASSFGYLPQKALLAHEDAPAARQRRWETLLPFVLTVAENMLGIIPKNDDLVERMYRARLQAWDRIYPESPVKHLAPLETVLANRRTAEAWYAMRHVELVDLMSYHDAAYLDGGESMIPSFDRIVETVISMEDLANRLMGGNITHRPNVIRKRAVIFSGPCLDLTARLPDHRTNSRKTVQDMTDELDRNFIECIGRYKNAKE